jgi:hypothetical protein
VSDPHDHKPVSWDSRARKRCEAIAGRALSCRIATPKLWWSLSDIWEAIDGHGWGVGPRPTLEKLCQEFLDALQAGTFDHHGKTRVALLNPQSPTALESPWPRLRLTAYRAQQILETHCLPAASAFRPAATWHFSHQYGRHILIEIDRAHNWLATWLDPAQFDGWLRCRAVAAALCAAAEIKPKQRRRQSPQASTLPVAISVGTEMVDPAALESAATQWFDEMAAKGERLTRREALDLARHNFDPALSKRKFDQRVWPQAPGAWKKPGRPQKRR